MKEYRHLDHDWLFAFEFHEADAVFHIEEIATKLRVKDLEEMNIRFNDSKMQVLVKEVDGDDMPYEEWIKPREGEILIYNAMTASWRARHTFTFEKYYIEKDKLARGLQREGYKHAATI